MPKKRRLLPQDAAAVARKLRVARDREKRRPVDGQKEKPPQKMRPSARQRAKNS